MTDIVQQIEDALAGMTRLSGKVVVRQGKDGERYDVLGHPCGFPVATFGDANDAHALATFQRDLPALVAEVKRLRAENERLRADLQRAINGEVFADCEGCDAPLFADDDFVSDPDCVHGCWHTMTDLPSKRERPCYAYRVGKPDARAALEPQP